MVLLTNNLRERTLALPEIVGIDIWSHLTMIFSRHIRTGLLLLPCLLVGCRSQTAPQFAQTPFPQVIAPAVGGLVATLEDEVRDLPDGQIVWTTYWKLCWEAYADAQEYELEPMTGEGTGRRRVRQAGVCYRVEVATGQNVKAQGFFNRELMLASLSGQMTYRVRAVLSSGRVSQWSTPAIVGQGGKPISTPPARTKQK